MTNPRLQKILDQQLVNLTQKSYGWMDLAPIASRHLLSVSWCIFISVVRVFAAKNLVEAVRKLRGRPCSCGISSSSSYQSPAPARCVHQIALYLYIRSRRHDSLAAKHKRRLEDVFVWCAECCWCPPGKRVSFSVMGPICCIHMGLSNSEQHATLLTHHCPAGFLLSNASSIATYVQVVVLSFGSLSYPDIVRAYTTSRASSSKSIHHGMGR